MMKPLIIAALAIAATSPAVAETVSAPTTTAKSKDPNRKICEKVERIGSRLATDRICMTAAQWEEHKRMQREHLERIQRNPNQAPSN